MDEREKPPRPSPVDLWISAGRPWILANGQVIIGRPYPDYYFNLDRELSEKFMHRVAEHLAEMPLCAYQPRAARLFGNGEGWLIESAHDQGASIATEEIQPTRLLAWLKLILELQQETQHENEE